MEEEPSVDAIATEISAGRPFEVELSRPTSQSVADLHWAALKAARRVGCKVSVRISKSTARPAVCVTVSRNRVR